MTMTHSTPKRLGRLTRFRSRQALCSLAMCAGLASSMGAQTPTLLRDINTSPPPEPSSWPSDYATAFGGTYFSAETVLQGRELFRTDGTAAGTQLVRDIEPGADDSRTWGFTEFAGRVFFGAEESTFGPEVWTTDGTAAGTQLFLETHPGTQHGSPGGFTVFGGKLFFSAHDPSAGIELWHSDGTPTGTQRFADLAPGTASSNPGELTVMGNRLLFIARDSLWVTDGTAGNTRQLTAVGSTGHIMAALGSRLLFTIPNASDSLWVTDGTVSGTRALAAGLDGVRPFPLVIGNQIYFKGFDFARGEELWKSDGTLSGTVLVRDIIAGSGSGELALLGAAGPLALMRVTRNGVRELWRSDGTAPGTTLVGPANVWPGRGIELNGELLFRVTDSQFGEELWKSDGTAAGTALVKDINPGRASGVPGTGAAVRLGTRVLFTARNLAFGGEPWLSDGTTAGTVMLTNLGSNPPGWTAGSGPESGVDWNGRFAFLASTTRFDPWVSDGTSIGTSLYYAFPGIEPFVPLNENGNPRLHVVGGRLLSLASEGSFTNLRIWSDSGNGPVAGSLIPLLGGSRPLAGWAYTGDLAWLGTETDLWRIRGASAQRLLLNQGGASTPTALVRAGASLLCRAWDGTRVQLFRCDAQGFTPVSAADPSDSEIVSAGQLAYFTRRDANHGHELWVTDGTQGGSRVLDLVPGPTGSQPVPLAEYLGHLLFRADDGVHGSEFWATRGTPATTFRLTNFGPNAAVNRVTSLHRLGLDRFVFVLDDGVHGTEPWTLAATGVALLRDLTPGPIGSWPELRGSIGDECYFEADGPSTTRSLWRSDGTAAGTTPLISAQRPDIGRQLTEVRGSLYFGFDDQVHGLEPWVVSIGATAKSIGEGCGVGMRASVLESDDPVLGQNATLRGGAGPVGSAGLLLFGFRHPQPVAHAGECIEYVDASTATIVHSISDAAATWQFEFVIPNLSALIGVHAALQSASGPTTNPSGFELSNGIVWTLNSW